MFRIHVFLTSNQLWNQKYDGEIFLRDLCEADFVDLGTNEATKAQSRSDQRCGELHGDKKVSTGYVMMDYECGTIRNEGNLLGLSVVG